MAVMSYAGLLIIVIGAGVVVALLAGIAALLANRKTRMIGFVLVLVPLPIVLVALGWLATYRAAARHEVAVQQEVLENQRARWEATLRVSGRSGGKSVADQSTPPSEWDGRIVSPSPSAPPKAAKTTPPAAKTPPASASPAPDRPNWVDRGPQRVNGVYQIPVATDPYESRLECEAHLPEALHGAIRQYIEKVYLPQEPAAAERVRLPLDFIRTQMIKAEWEEPFDASVGPMVRLHALVEFSHEANTRIDEAWQKSVVDRRLWILGAALGGLLWMLSVVWGYLKADLATNGAYRWRLRFLAAVAILAVAAAGLAVVS